MQASMPAVLVPGHTATQNSPFLPQRQPQPSPALIEPTRGGMARLNYLYEHQDSNQPKLQSSKYVNFMRWSKPNQPPVWWH